ncbi:hypothetical protein ACNO7T_15755 [Vibrio campbellii]
MDIRPNPYYLANDSQQQSTKDYHLALLPKSSRELIEEKGKYTDKQQASYSERRLYVTQNLVNELEALGVIEINQIDCEEADIYDNVYLRNVFTGVGDWVNFTRDSEDLHDQLRSKGIVTYGEG